MSSPIAQFQNGQSDLEIAPIDITILLQPFYGTAPITNLEATGGGIDATKLANCISVGNVTKRDGFKLTNNPTINNIMSTGKGTPTAIVASEAVKSINYVPQQFTKLNMQVYWGAVDSAFSAPSAHGGFTVSIPELPANLFFRAILLGAAFAGDGNPIIVYWIANKAIPAKRSDMSLVDSNVIEHPAELMFLTDDNVGVPLIGGACGAGFQTLTGSNDAGFQPSVTSININPTTATVTAATGGGHTKQLQVLDSNGFDVTDSATFTTWDVTKATVSPLGVVTGVATGTGNVTAEYHGHTATCAITVT